MAPTTQSSAPSGIREQDVLLSGGFGRSTNSARAGFIPISLEHVPSGALEGIPVYIRVRAGEAASERGAEAPSGGFRLYCAEAVRFSDFHRLRLVEHGVKFVYVRMADQSRFRRQTEARLGELAADPAVAISERSEIIYETSVELMNELLAEPELHIKSQRLGQLSHAITTLVMNNPTAFSHLFAASHHDFYTATHMVNVATWMVPLAYELGHRGADELNTICMAGILHDMGKTDVPEEILNKSGKLSDEDWRQIRRHPVAGCEYLSRFGLIDPLILTVTRQHHERLDGTGYPDGLKGEQIHPISRICAVVDSFDAMTAFRPFKERTLGVGEALDILRRETPAKYDPVVVDAWMRLMQRAEETQAGPAPEAPGPVAAPRLRRRHARQAFHCQGRAHILVRNATGTEERPAVPVVAHSVSRSGLGFLSQIPILPGEFIRVYLAAKGWSGRPLDGQTVRCRAHTDSWHEIGMQFTVVENEGENGPDLAGGA